MTVIDERPGIHPTRTKQTIISVPQIGERMEVRRRALRHGDLWLMVNMNSHQTGREIQMHSTI